MAKYMDIVNNLRNEIVFGEYKNNVKIPDETALGLTYSASKLTIKKAVDILVREGLLVKKQGSGTYINTLGSTQPSLDSNDITMPSSLTNTYKDHKTTSKVLEFNIIKASETIASSLLIEPDEFVYYVHRVRYVDSIANSIEEVYMPIKTIPGLNLNIVEHSIYDYIMEELHLKPKSFHKYIYSRSATFLEQKELDLNKQDPVSIVEQIAFLDNGIPYEYSLVAHHFNMFKYKAVVVL